MAGSRAKYIYADPQWRWVRQVVLKRDGWQCVECKRGGAAGLEVHHKTGIAAGGAAFDTENLQTLCVKCHRRRHRKRRKLSAGQRDWQRLVAEAREAGRRRMRPDGKLFN